MTTKIGIIAGSTRQGSYNRRLARIASADAREAGADVTDIDLRNFQLPIYAHEIEFGDFPTAALELKALFQAQDAILFASPEYNGSVTGLLKNAIDWASRPTDGESPIALSAFRGKAAGIMSASLSPFGGLRSLAHLRQILGTVQMLVVPEQVAIPSAHQAFDDDDLVDAMPRQLITGLVGSLLNVGGKLGSE